MEDERKRIESAIQALESQRALLGDAAVDAALAALKIQLTPAEQSEGQELRFAGERKLVTVMFADISGFTALSEKLDPEEIRALMNACFDHLVPVIQEYEGTVDKFIGDEIMALFGAPVAHERHAELACFAALELFEALGDFNRRNGTGLEMHIGINSGLVIAGGIGSRGRQEYSVMGDAVNMAARLKDAAGPGQVFVGSEVYGLTGHCFHFNALPPLRLKGKKDLVSTYSLTGRKRDPGVSRESALHSDLIGREAELRQLTALLHDLHKGRGCMISVIGEAGIGKSRLITELLNRVKGSLNRVEGRSLSNSRQRAYQPALEIMLRLTGASADMEAGQIKTRLQKELTGTLGEKGSTALPFLAQMMQLPLTENEDTAVRYLNAASLREKIFTAFSTYLEAKSALAPLILVWEDLHWSDPSSLALLEHTLSCCLSSPLALILVFRPQKEEKIWQLHEAALKKFENRYHTFMLEPLTVGDSAQLMRQLIHVDKMDTGVEQIILNKAEGNPFFVEELLRSLLDNGMLYLEGQTIKASEKLDGLAVPGTLQGVIASRIDRLERNDKLNLQTASILGRLFQEKVLASLLARIKRDDGLSRSLAQLVERELLRERANNDRDAGEYIFKHAVTHDVTYNSLLMADRKALHRLAGETIEEMAGAEKDDFAESLAFHYERADQQEKAVYFLRQAAGRAQKIHANEEALELYRRAIKQADELIRQGGNNAQWRSMLGELFENQADVLRLTVQPDKAKAAYLQAMEHTESHDGIGQARLYRKMGLCLQSSSQFHLMLEHFQRAQQLLEEDTGDKTPLWWNEWIELLTEQMLIYYWTNKPEEIERLSQRVQRAIQAYGTPLQQARYYQNLVALNFRLERYLLSSHTVQLAETFVANTLISKDLQMLAVAKFFLGFSLLWHNSLPECIAVLEESLALARQTGDLIFQARNLTYLTVAHRRQGNVEQTDFYVRQSMETARNVSMQEYVGTAYANQAWLAWKNGDMENIEILGKQAIDNWKKVPETHSSLVFIWMTAWPLAALYCHRGNMTKCMEQLDSMIQPNLKRMEPELEQRIQEVVAGFKISGIVPNREDLSELIALGEHYRYL